MNTGLTLSFLLSFSAEGQLLLYANYVRTCSLVRGERAIDPRAEAIA